MKKSSDGLLPCPFCGCSPDTAPENPKEQGDAWTEISCDCEAQPCVTTHIDKGHFEEATRIWNTRTTPPNDHIKTLVEALREYQNEPCMTKSAEDIEPGCCRNCRTKILLASLPNELKGVG